VTETTVPEAARPAPGGSVAEPVIPAGAAGLLGDAAAAGVAQVAADELGCDPGEVDLSSVRRLSGGASRHTFSAEPSHDGRSVHFAVQTERSGSVGANLPMHQQVALLRDAADSGVPVPRVRRDGGEAGSGWVVLDWLEGEAVARRILRGEEFADARADLAREAGSVLARIHQISPGPHRGLPEADPLESMSALAEMVGEAHPAFAVGLSWLEANRPAERSHVVVHGDFRMGNLLVSPGGITAVLDWELAHIGSPVEDLGWFCSRAWRFGSPLRAGGVGTAEDLLEGYRQGGGEPVADAELRWWEVYATLRWGLICVLQASVHLRGLHRSVELAAIGRRAAECEEDLLALICGPSDYQPPRPGDAQQLAGPHDRPDSLELLEALGEKLEDLRGAASGSTAFDLRVCSNVAALVGREMALSATLADMHSRRLAELAVRDEAGLVSRIQRSSFDELSSGLLTAVREMVRDKLAVSNPGYWEGDS